MTTLNYILDRYRPVLTKNPLFVKGDRHVDFPQMIKDLNFKVGVEIGVEQGVFAESLLKDTGLYLYGIDPWKAYKQYREHTSQDKLDRFYEETKARLQPYSHTLIRKTSEEAVKDFKDNSVDFIYIDGNHEYFHVVKDIVNWMPKLKKGGIMAGHDFRRNSGKYTNDVKDVVPSYAYAKKISPWFVLDDVNRPSSWFWVKQ